jgi:hypothetical protein
VLTGDASAALWAVVLEEYDERAPKQEEEEEEEAVRTLVLLSDVAVANTDDARALYADRRSKGRIEHGYRFWPGGGFGRGRHEGSEHRADAAVVRFGAFGDAIRDAPDGEVA